MSVATVAPRGAGSTAREKVLGKFVDRPRRRGKTPPQKQGPAPELSGPHYLPNAGEADLTKEFDLSPQGKGVQIGGHVIFLERSIVHATESIVCCPVDKVANLEFIDPIPFCVIVKSALMMCVSTKVGTFRLYVLNANAVRFEFLYH
jgi:hypothetical protein